MIFKNIKLMKFDKVFYFNVIFFTFVIVMVFVFGFLINQNINNISAATIEDDVIAPSITNVQISQITATSSIVTWTTDELADSLINFGLDKNYGILREPRADKIEHNLLLEDLRPGSTYYFRITSSDVDGNQGISSDFYFTTIEDEDKTEKTGEKESEDKGIAEDVMNLGEGGLSQEGVADILQVIENVSSEEILEIIDEKIKEKAEEIISPPTIILDYADVEVGTDYAIISWMTDKEANSIVALAREDDYDELADDPYTWKVGEPDEYVLEHVVEVFGLTPATTYDFQVISRSQIDLEGRSSNKTFKTKSILPEIFNVQLSKVEEESATIRWATNVPCSAIVEYTNLNTNETKLEGNNRFLTIHSMKLSNLIFDTYYSAIIRVESEEGEKAISDPIAFITTRDKYPPVITKVNTESTLYPGTENKIQTITSWWTDEDSICQLFYHQGLVSLDDDVSFLPKEEARAVKHVEVITNFLPSVVYKFWIICEDDAGNVVKSQDFTMLTPSQEESIIDIILKNFESSFGWVKKIGG